MSPGPAVTEETPREPLEPCSACPHTLRVGDRPLFQADGTVDAPALAVLVHRIDSTLSEIRAPLADLLEAEADAIKARALREQVLTKVIASKPAAAVLTVLALSISAACLNVAGLPVEEVFRFFIPLPG